MILKPAFVKILHILAIPLQKPKQKQYNYYILLTSTFFIAIPTITVLQISFLYTQNPINAILQILVCCVINFLNLAAIFQAGFNKTDKMDKLITDLTLFIEETLEEKKLRYLLKLQNIYFIVIHITLVPWIIFMPSWIIYWLTFSQFLTVSPIYINYYVTMIEAVKMMFLLQYLSYSIEENSRQIDAILNKKYVKVEHVLEVAKNYDKLLDCISLFNECFGFQILIIVILTPLAIVQAFFFTLSKMFFTSILRTIVVNVAIFVKMFIFLVRSIWLFLFSLIKKLGIFRYLFT